MAIWNECTRLYGTFRNCLIADNIKLIKFLIQEDPIASTQACASHTNFTVKNNRIIFALKNSCDFQVKNMSHDHGSCEIFMCKFPKHEFHVKFLLHGNY